MKNYKQILEAINRGINLALDDFDDEELSPQKKAKLQYNRNYTQEYLDLMDMVVDLGLPSGTLWCKYNLGVDFENKRKLRFAKNWVGDKYKWGETAPHNMDNKWETYKFSKAGDHQLTKYCTDSNYGMMGFNDRIKLLLPEDDIATISLGNYFHIPTDKQFEELIKYTTNRWIVNYKNIPNLDGKLFISKINGNEIFFPKYIDNKFENFLNVSYSWSSIISEFKPDTAYILSAPKLNPPNVIPNSRVRAVTIRPVAKL